jgi:predicted nuclease of predicted toxin-antitoxin system
MRVLLDESVPVQLKAWLSEHDVRTVVEMSWRGLKNGALLDAAEKQFQVFVTADQGIPHQQRLASRTIAIIVIPTNRKREVEALATRISTAVMQAKPGTASFVAKE